MTDLKKTQVVFNKWIRHRDRMKPCISCGGRIAHAGHYFSAGTYGHLRFHEDNVHGQCVGCNTYKHGNLIHYRQGLLNRIGKKRLAELEKLGVQKIKKWTKTELQLIRERYAQATS